MDIPQCQMSEIIFCINLNAESINGTEKLTLKELEEKQLQQGISQLKFLSAKQLPGGPFMCH